MLAFLARGEKASMITTLQDFIGNCPEFGFEGFDPFLSAFIFTAAGLLTLLPGVEYPLWT